LEKLKRRDEALVAYGRGIELAPDDVKLHIKRGWVYRERPEQHGLAEEDFLAAVRGEPGNAGAHTGLGFLSAAAHSEQDAQRHATLALLNANNDYMILHNMACLYTQLSLSSQDQSEYQDIAMALLRRAKDLWGKRGDGYDYKRQLRQDD